MGVVFAKVQALADAVGKLSGKTPIGSLLKSADWQNVPLEMRDRAFFSATVTSADFLAEAQKGITEMAQLARRAGLGKDGGDGAFQNEQSLIADLQAKAKALGLGPEDPLKAGTLEDITSLQRLELVVRHNLQSAQEYARWKAEQNPAVLDAYPAQELVRVEPRDVPRGMRRTSSGALVEVPAEGWPARWERAGGTLINGRMVALKSDGIWAKISRFGTPWPPFDFGSGMGLVDVSREDAEALGIIDRDTMVTIPEHGFNEELQASLENVRPEMRRALEVIFGDQVDVSGDTVKWRNAA